MGITRRQVLAGTGSAFTTLWLTKAVLAQVPPHPDPAKFESGDFLWPAKEGAFIPFFNPSTDAIDAQEREWNAQRHLFIEEARRSGDLALIAAADRLENTDFREFRSLYYDDRPPGASAHFSIPTPEVGHCALVDIDAGGARWVVEAIPRGGKRYESLYTRFPDGVVRTPYASWIAEHPDYRVWHGRLDGFAAPERAKITEAAKAYLGRDYWFFSFDLADEKAFYCSKLLWAAVKSALQVALDHDNATSRSFWVSPKRLINAQGITLLHNPGRF